MEETITINNLTTTSANNSPLSIDTFAWSTTNTPTPITITPPAPKAIKFKFDEDRLFTEIENYVAKTYKSHYAGGDDEVQAFELIAQGKNLRGVYFAVGNAIKYGSRYGAKAGYNRDDLMKIVHYGLMSLWAHDQAVKKGVIKE